MTYTPNLGLTKDAPTERYDVGRVNANSDRIDTFAGSARADINNLQVDMAGKQDLLLYDTEPTEGSQRMLKSGAIYTALTAKQDTLVAGGNMDQTPTEDSVLPVTSGGVFAAIADKPDMTDVWGLAATALAPNSGDTDDLNDKTTPGLYRAQSATEAARVSNAPFSNAGYLLVVRILQNWRKSGSNDNRYCRQEIYSAGKPESIYVRHFRGANGWTPWYVFTGAQVT